MEMKTMWSEFYGGTITVQVCEKLDEIPVTARYKYDDDETDFVTPEEALREISLDTLAAYMDDDVREQVHREIAPCTELEFLSRYLQLAKDDLIF